MAYPRWLARVNKKIFNPRALKSGKWPVVAHVGRSSGRSYRTPMDAHPTRDGYVLVVRYGPKSDWVRNILASGEAELTIDDRVHALAHPRLVTREEAVAALLPGFDPGKDFYGADEYLLLDAS